MSTIATRIIEIVEAVGESKSEFARRINVTPAYISKLSKESNRNLSDRTISDVCKEFHVDEHWLRTGEGEMFLPRNQNEEFDRICTAIQLSDDVFIREILKLYWGLSDEYKKALQDTIIEIAEKVKKERQ